MRLTLNIIAFLYFAAGIAWAMYIDKTERRLKLFEWLLVMVSWLPVILFYRTREEGD